MTTILNWFRTQITKLKNRLKPKPYVECNCKHGYEWIGEWYCRRCGRPSTSKEGCNG